MPQDETEADVTACHYMVEALNISPRYGVKFLKKLKKTSGEMPEFLNGIIGDHPLLDERIKRLEEECESMGY